MQIEANLRCKKCSAGLPPSNPWDDRCALCWNLDLRFSQAVSLGTYRGLLQELVIRMKNQHDEPLAMQLGYLLAQQIRESAISDAIDLVIPVATHWWRRLERGFHASEVLAETVSQANALPYSRQILRSLRKTKKQGMLSTAGRFTNVRGAFGVAKTANVRGLNLLVIDDVMTSGATSSEISRILIRAGAAKVYVGVIARGARVS